MALRHIAAVLIAIGIAGAQTVLTRVDERPEIYRQGPWLWDGSCLIGVENNVSSTPVLWKQDRNGRKEEIYFSIPDVGYITLIGMAASTDGTIVIAGGMLGNDGKREGFVASIPPRRDRTLIRMEDYSPRAVTVAPDGVIWTVGSQKVDDNPLHTLNNVLKRFSPSGKLLTSEAQRAVGPPNMLTDPASTSSLRSSRDRVAWFTAGFEYLEYSLDGSLKNRFPGPDFGTKHPGLVTFAVSDDFGAVLGNAGRIWTLDRVKGKWNPVMIGEPLSRGNVYGFDGDQLVIGDYTNNRGFLIIHCKLE